MAKWEAIVRVNMSTMTVVQVEADTYDEALQKASTERPHGEADAKIESQEVISVIEITK